MALTSRGRRALSAGAPLDRSCRRDISSPTCCLLLLLLLPRPGVCGDEFSAKRLDWNNLIYGGAMLANAHGVSLCRMMKIPAIFLCASLPAVNRAGRYKYEKKKKKLALSLLQTFSCIIAPFGSALQSEILEHRGSNSEQVLSL